MMHDFFQPEQTFCKQQLNTQQAENDAGLLLNEVLKQFKPGSDDTQQDKERLESLFLYSKGTRSCARH